VWPGEIPPGWELECVEDDYWEHHGWPPVVLPLPVSLIQLFQKHWTTSLWQKLRFVIIKPFGVQIWMLMMLYLCTHLRVSLMHICWSLLLFKWFTGR
jgi:hypothetical protein